ncbi:MAG: hypothetical protein KBC69_00800 [Candidatus Magasanikbacteria bacterium]|nr:hypothetical protein [Candidatus Magasanikbacteria bacterium]
MTALIIVLVTLVLVFVPLAIFLGREHLKKFGFMQDFVKRSDHLIVWRYEGSKEKGRMANIVLRSSKPFCALVGFKLSIPLVGYSGFDYYGRVWSDDRGVAVISTYLGKGACDFQFLVNMDVRTNPVEVSSSEDDQVLRADEVYPPHWYQKWLGFYG